MIKGYYIVKFTDSEKKYVLFWNGCTFESFKSDNVPIDSIEEYIQLSLDKE